MNTKNKRPRIEKRPKKVFTTTIQRKDDVICYTTNKHGNGKRKN